MVLKNENYFEEKRLNLSCPSLLVTRVVSFFKTDAKAKTNEYHFENTQNYKCVTVCDFMTLLDSKTII